MPVSLPPMRGLRELYPEGAVRLSGAEPPSPNLQDAPKLDLSAQGGAPMSPDAQLAGLLSGASRAGQRDTFSQMLLRAGVAGAGPLSGIFSALGAALAGKDPDFAAAAAQEGFRRLHQQQMADEAFAIQKREARLRTLREAVSAAAAAGYNKKQMRPLVDQLLHAAGINVPEYERDIISNQPFISRLMVNKGTEKDVQELMAWLDETGYGPEDSWSIRMALGAAERISMPKEPAAVKPGEVLPYEDAVRSLVAESGMSEENAREFLAIGEEAGVVDATLYNQIVSRATTGGDEAMLGSGLGQLFAERMGRPEYAGLIAQLPVKQVGPVMAQLRQLMTQNEMQMIETAANQVFERGEPLSAGQMMTLQMIQDERALDVLRGTKGLAEEIAVLMELEGADSPGVEVLQNARAQSMQALSRIPAILQMSAQLADTFTLDELKSGENPYDDWEALNLGGQ